MEKSEKVTKFPSGAFFGDYMNVIDAIKERRAADITWVK